MAPDEYRHDEVALDVLWVWPDQPSVGSVYASAHGIDFLVLIRIEQMRHSSRQLCSQESFNCITTQ